MHRRTDVARVEDNQPAIRTHLDGRGGVVVSVEPSGQDGGHPLARRVVERADHDVAVPVDPARVSPCVRTRVRDSARIAEPRPGAGADRRHRRGGRARGAERAHQRGKGGAGGASDQTVSQRAARVAAPRPSVAVRTVLVLAGRLGVTGQLPSRIVLWRAFTGIVLAGVVWLYGYSGSRGDGLDGPCLLPGDVAPDVQETSTLTGEWSWLPPRQICIEERLDGTRREVAHPGPVEFAVAGAALLLPLILRRRPANRATAAS